MKKEPEPFLSKSTDEIYADFNELIGNTIRVSKSTPKGVEKHTSKKILISDVHSPFIDKVKLTKLMTSEKDVDELIVNGDIDDLYPLSRFLKHKEIDAVYTLKELTCFTQIVSEHYPKVKYLKANHDERVFRFFQRSGIPVHIIEAFVRTDYLDFIIAPYKNVNIVKTLVTLEHHPEIYHFQLIGKDCVAGHWETYSKVNLRSAENCFNWYQQWRSTLGLPEIKILLQSHTHQLGSRMVWGDKMYGETGTLALVQDYTIDGRVGYTPPQTGYWIIIQRDGITDLRETRYVPL